MPDISNILIKDSYQYVVQCDLSTLKFYRLDGTELVNPIFTSGLTVNGLFVADTISATTYQNLPIDPNTFLTGGSFSSGVLTLNNNDGSSISVSGVSQNIRHWLENDNITISPDETVVISGNYVLSNTDLTLLNNPTNFNIMGIDFSRRAQLYIGGYLLLIDSNIVNNGLINVAGGIIFSGISTVTGTGIIN